MPAETETRILRTPIRQLAPADVHDWYYAAYAPTIAATELRWITPRTMDLMAQGEDACGLGNELVFARCEQTGKPDTWPAPERAVLHDYAAALIQARAQQDWPDLDTYFCMVSKAHIPMPHLTGALDSLPPATLARALLAQFEDGPISFGASTFWGSPDGHHERDIAQLDAHFASKTMADRFNTAILTANDEESEVLWDASDLVAKQLRQNL